ncbi:MAG: ATP-binding protein [bacterium]
MTKKKKKNRRTLRKRVFWVVSLCILITILLFGGIVVFLTSHITGGIAYVMAQFYSYNIAREMNSDYFLERMNISGLEELDETNLEVKRWLSSIDFNNDLSLVFEKEGLYREDVVIEEKENPGQDFVGLRLGVNLEEENKTMNLSMGNVYDMGLFITYIKLNDRLINITADVEPGRELSSDVIEKGGIEGGIIEHFVNYYSDFEAKSPLYDSSDNEIGSVVTTINPEIVFFLFIVMTIPIIIAGIVCLIIALFVSKLLTIPISKPLCQLDQKMKAIAREDYSAGKEQKVELRRPLREVESIADSTNEIISNMKRYSDLLEEQKNELENKNDELEAQNIELEEQKEEIEAQHEALVESKAKLEAAQTQLLQSEKMASIGQLTAAIAHEINTPLGAINSNVQLFDMLLNNIMVNNDNIKSHQELQGVIEQMIESNKVSVMACSRVKEIIRSLKQFSSLDQAEYQETELQDCLKSVLILTSNLWKNKVTIHEEYADIPEVKCFPGLLNQVFMNIIVNSIHAIGDKGNIYIRTEQVGDQAVITIEDDGSGIPEKVINRIFDYGFTTKKDGQGMGVGLAISKNIIDKHNGELKVLSKEGQGAKFIISIPIDGQ